MQGILADINVQGHVRILVTLLESPAWQGLWTELNLPVYTLADLNLPVDTPDAVVWQLCQERQFVFLTNNRNKDGPDSLQAAIERGNTPTSLPVLTFADAEQVRRSRDYADRVVVSLLEYLMDIDNYRGTGRLFLP